MKVSTLIFAIGGTILFWFLLGYLVGKYKERTDWNKLIEQGKIPAPKK